MRRCLLKVTLACAASVAIAPAALADIQIEEIPFFWSVNDGNEALAINIPQFDDQGGTRLLNAVTISSESASGLAARVEATVDRMPPPRAAISE